MLVSEFLQSGPTRPAIPGDLGALISAIGENDFEARFVNYINETCGAEHFALFALDADAPSELLSASLDGTDTSHRQVERYLRGSYWRRDPSMIAAREHVSRPVTTMLRLDTGHLQDAELRLSIYERTSVRERVLLCGGPSLSRNCLIMLRPQESGLISGEGLARLRHIGQTLLALIEKHASVAAQRRKPALALSSLSAIEGSIRRAPQPFTQRERQVVARIIYGMSTTGMALELGVSEETVTTYRKRAYQRIEIATQRELILWYLNLWSRPDWDRGPSPEIEGDFAAPASDAAMESGPTKRGHDQTAQFATVPH